MMRSKINWGIIGVGNIAHKIAPAIAKFENANLVAIASRSIENAQQFANRHNVPKVYNSYMDLARDPDIDVVYIASTHNFHCEHALLCLDNGKSVLCEKPFAINEKEVNKMISKAREKDLFLMEAMWTRFLPLILKTVELIQSGVIGEIIHIKSDFGFKPPYDPNKRLFNKDLAGGALLDIGVYPLFISLLLLGEPSEIKALFKIGNTGVDESGSVILRYPDNKLANLFFTFLAETTTETDIFGTKGHIRINKPWFIPNSISVFANNTLSETYDFNYEVNGYEFEIEEVMKCIQNNKKESDLMPLELSLKLIRLLDKVRHESGIEYQNDK